MNDWDKKYKQALRYKEMYPVGTRLVLESMDDPYSPIEPGTRGTVRFVDDMGTIHMNWDNGRTLGLVPGEDRFRALTQKELLSESLDDIAGHLEDFFWAQHICMSVDVKNGHLYAKDDEGNKWKDGEIFDFALNECLCFNQDGSLSSGLAAAEPFVERLKEDAKKFGVEITSYTKSIEQVLDEATVKSKEMKNNKLVEKEQIYE